MLRRPGPAVASPADTRHVHDLHLLPRNLSPEFARRHRADHCPRAAPRVLPRRATGPRTYRNQTSTPGLQRRPRHSWGDRAYLAEAIAGGVVMAAAMIPSTCPVAVAMTSATLRLNRLLIRPLFMRAIITVPLSCW